MFQDTFDLDIEPSAADKSYTLESLEVCNWGPFKGLHRAEIDPSGTAIIGPTGSGKTTLIDAWMTLLVERPQYNLASTGGHDKSDRSLISYIRGVLGGDGSSSIDNVSRPGKTITGLCATYTDGEQSLQLGAILWTTGTSNSSTDLKRIWIFSEADGESLEQWICTVHDEGARNLTRHGKETAQLRLFESKKAYLAHVRKFFGVSENAFTLLNRAAGLKQLNSINEIFRDLVLDDHSAFERALEVAAEFDNLADIHAELETAKRQVESLEPIEKENKRLKKQRTRLQVWQSIKNVLATWFAVESSKRWQEKITALKHERTAQQATLTETQETERRMANQAEALRENYLRLGGNVIAELENTITEQQSRVTEKRTHAESYSALATQLDLDTKISPTSLAKNQAQVSAKKSKIEKDRAEREELALDAQSRHRDLSAELDEVTTTLNEVKNRPKSNIPIKFQNFRTHLADNLALDEDEVPYVAEMVEVMPDQQDWRGAIERAIGSERLRLLVPEDKMRTALQWVNSRDNRLHVRLASAEYNQSSPNFFNDGYTRKLNYKKHPLREAVKQLLASRDRHCVASADELEDTEYGMTIQGTMSDRRGRFEKQDQRRLDQDWMTGFDNRDQLRFLQTRQTELKAEVADWKETSELHRRRLRETDALLQLIDQLANLDFATIDLPSALADLDASRERLRQLLDPNSNTSKAKTEFDNVQNKLQDIRAEITRLTSKLAVLENNLELANDKLEQTNERAAQPLTDQEAAAVAKEISIDRDISVENLEVYERAETLRIDNHLKSAQTRVHDHEQRIVRQMEGAQRVDTGALSEIGTNIDDVPDYLEQLRILRDEALPEKRERFLNYLTASSDQGVTQLLAGIAQEVDNIEQRIYELNRTLAKVDYRDGRYLQLQPQRLKHERLRSIESAQKQLRSAALKEDGGQSHYHALKNVVSILRDAGENRRQLGSRALLDPRHRLDFCVVEVDRATDARSAPRSGSQSGSGGEKELMASHILTPSLHYALCPAEAVRPLHGTVVLDEAFSKSSPSAAERIIEALRIFHLHPVFVTPNKEIGLLKKHTSRVVCVHRLGMETTLSTISWATVKQWASQKPA